MTLTATVLLNSVGLRMCEKQGKWIKIVLAKKCVELFGFCDCIYSGYCVGKTGLNFGV